MEAGCGAVHPVSPRFAFEEVEVMSVSASRGERGSQRSGRCRQPIDAGEGNKMRKRAFVIPLIISCGNFSLYEEDICAAYNEDENECSRCCHEHDMDLSWTKGKDPRCDCMFDSSRCASGQTGPGECEMCCSGIGADSYVYSDAGALCACQWMAAFMCREYFGASEQVCGDCCSGGGAPQYNYQPLEPATCSCI